MAFVVGLRFDPGIGLVFYDEKDQIVAYLSLCMHCHNMRSEPPLDLGFEIPSKSGFAKMVHGKLFHLFRGWGVG